MRQFGTHLSKDTGHVNSGQPAIQPCFSLLLRSNLLHCVAGIGPKLGYDSHTSHDVLRPNKVFAGKRHAVSKLKMQSAYRTLLSVAAFRTAIAGVSLELLHAPGETDDQILVWMPEKKVLFW